MVKGAVNSPGPVAYSPGKNLDWYVDAAGGYSAGRRQATSLRDPAERRAGGRQAEGGAPGQGAAPEPGAVVFVPTRIVQEQGASLAQILGVGAQLLTALVTVIVVAKQ